MIRNGDGVIDLFLCLDVSENTFVTEILNYFFSTNPKTMKSAQYSYVLYMVIYGKIFQDLFSLCLQQYFMNITYNDHVKRRQRALYYDEVACIMWLCPH